MSANTSRASFLSGLRTGGVRHSSWNEPSPSYNNSTQPMLNEDHHHAPPRTFDASNRLVYTSEDLSSQPWISPEATISVAETRNAYQNSARSRVESWSGQRHTQSPDYQDRQIWPTSHQWYSEPQQDLDILSHPTLEDPHSFALDSLADRRLNQHRLNPRAESFRSMFTNDVKTSFVDHQQQSTRVQHQAQTASSFDPSSILTTSFGSAVSASAQQKHMYGTSRRPSMPPRMSSSGSSRSVESSARVASPPIFYVSTPEETMHRRVSLAGSTSSSNVETPGMSFQGSDFVSYSPGGRPQSELREEASRKLYESLTTSRKRVNSTVDSVPNVSQPTRQPRGPPSGVDELGHRNFAARIRRQAIGGLEALMDARGRRTSMHEVEAY